MIGELRARHPTELCPLEVQHVLCTAACVRQPHRLSANQQQYPLSLHLHPHTLEPLKELGLNTLAATRLALKLHAHSVQYAYKLCSARRALERLFSTLITKIRHGLLQGIHGASALGVLFSLIDVEVVLTAFPPPVIAFFSSLSLVLEPGVSSNPPNPH
eukprot:645929-Pelagomonas_calceolata.AAC.1